MEGVHTSLKKKNLNFSFLLYIFFFCVGIYYLARFDDWSLRFCFYFYSKGNIKGINIVVIDFGLYSSVLCGTTANFVLMEYFKFWVMFQYFIIKHLYLIDNILKLMTFYKHYYMAPNIYDCL